VSFDLDRSATAVAPDLLGALLTTRVDDEPVTVRIVEVEAYEGADDPAAHSFRGETARNRTMFGPPGVLYVYRHLGLHHCANVVVGPAGMPHAVLLRGAEVIGGVDVAWRRRLASGVCRTERDLARGPARLAVVLGLTREHDGAPIGEAAEGGLLTIAARDADLVVQVATGPRVGIPGSGPEAASRPWRFWIAGDPHVSAGR